MAKSVRIYDSAWWGIQDYTWLETFQKFKDWYWNNSISEGAQINMVGNESGAEFAAFKKTHQQTAEHSVWNRHAFYIISLGRW